MATSAYATPFARAAVCAAGLLFFLALTAPIAEAATIIPTRIVPECGVSLRGGNNELTGVQNLCTFCHALQLVQNVLNYTWWVITPTLLTIALIWGGSYMFFSSFSGDAGMSQRGKKIIYHALIGAALVFGAWLIIDTVIKVLGGRIGSKTASAPFLPWNKIECVEPEVTVTLPPPDVTAPPVSVGTEQALAQAVFSQNTCTGNASCGSVNACSTLRNVSQGLPPPVCFNGCTATTPCPQNPNVHLSIQMLQALDSLYKDGYKFVITSITTGSHAPNSKHYQGKAVDLVAVSPTTYTLLASALINRGGIARCEKGGVTVSCTSGNVDHVHAEFP